MRQTAISGRLPVGDPAAINSCRMVSIAADIMEDSHGSLNAQHLFKVSKCMYRPNNGSSQSSRGNFHLDSNRGNDPTTISIKTKKWNRGLAQNEHYSMRSEFSLLFVSWLLDLRKE